MRQVGYLQRLYRDARSTEHKIVLVSLCRNIFYVIVQGEQTSSLDLRGLWRKAFLFSNLKKSLTLHPATSYNENDVSVRAAWKTLSGGLFGCLVLKRCQSRNGVAADGQPCVLLLSGMLGDAGLQMVTDFSEQPICPYLKGRLLGPWRWYR